MSDLVERCNEWLCGDGDGAGQGSVLLEECLKEIERRKVENRKLQQEAYASVNMINEQYDKIERLEELNRALGDANRQLDECCNDYCKAVLDDLRAWGRTQIGNPKFGPDSFLRKLDAYEKGRK